MKTLLTSIFLLLIFSLLCCQKHNSDHEMLTGVDLYISQLRSNQYDSIELPAFTPAEISALLKYRNDTTIVTKVPVNFISSYAQQKCNLGMIALWTIESIRAVQINSKFLVGRFPSQNPFLALRDSPGVWFFDNQSQFEAAKAYYDWWYSSLSLSEKMNTDPLKDTKYKWH